jgi:radical SAM protein (TIGR01212 family)
MLDTCGVALYRIPIDLQLGCPNREIDGSGGCAFCPADGARAVQTRNVATVAEQISEAVKFAKLRYGAEKFMAYFQAFTTTHATPAEQRRFYEEVLKLFPFDAVTIATRPDCLDSGTLRVLEALDARVDLWIELGVQTLRDETLRRINRGHTAACSLEAIRKLSERRIKIAPHVIIGLPGETEAQISQMADQIGSLPVQAVKIHNLHVIHGTQLAREFAENPFPVYDEHEYGEILIDFLRRLPAGLPIIRFSTDTPKEDLVAPRWTLSKTAFSEWIARQMTLRECRQGDMHPSAQPPAVSRHREKPLLTDDGSVSFWSQTYRQHYHMKAGARHEALTQYVNACGFTRHLGERNLNLLDVCFGLGYNTLTACSVAERLQAGRLCVTALEMDRRVVGAAAREVLEEPGDSFSWRDCLEQLYATGRFQADYFDIRVIWGDARRCAGELCEGDFDLTFLDPFSSQRNSELWTVDFFRKLFDCLSDDGILLTYSSSIPVRAGLIRAGFHVGKNSHSANCPEGTVATKSVLTELQPLTTGELHLIHETARGVHYRDPSHIWSNGQILKDRQDRMRAFSESRFAIQ